MANGATAWIGGGAAAAYAEMVNATKASGAIVKVEPNVFEQLANKTAEPLIVYSEGGFFSRNYKYLMNYKGLFFFTKSPSQLALPAQTELIRAKKIWVPD